MSLDRLLERIEKLQNPSVVGLDPKLDYIPPHILKRSFLQYGRTLEGAADAILTYNKALIDALCDIIPAVKPQAAYYEIYGWQGVKALAKTISYAKKKGMFVITDGKRNDIGTTMAAYASAHLGTVQVDYATLTPFGADALTVNGYLGSDGIKPLLGLCKDMDKGIFVLVKTSNPSSGELQDLCVGNTPVYAVMGDMCETWGKELLGAYGYSAVGAVVGATYPEQLGELRSRLPHTMFLVPGYGAQGGGARDVANAFDENGWGAAVNSSRAILCAWKREESCPAEDFAGAARQEAMRMRKDIVDALEQRLERGMSWHC